jgi:hypothetical protein
MMFLFHSSSLVSLSVFPDNISHSLSPFAPSAESLSISDSMSRVMQKCVKKLSDSRGVAGDRHGQNAIGMSTVRLPASALFPGSQILAEHHARLKPVSLLLVLVSWTAARPLLLFIKSPAHSHQTDRQLHRHPPYHSSASRRPPSPHPGVS